MRPLKFISVSILASILAGCTSDNLDFVRTEICEKGNPFGVELVEALECANSILSQIEGEKTRSVGRRVKSSHPILASNALHTRSSALPDTLFYLVNYENNEGFAVLAADRRLSPVIAISDEGQLAMSDTLFNEPLRLFFQGAMSDAEAVMSLSTPTIQPDTTIQSYPIVNVTRKTLPLLSKNVQLWHQGSPYNNLVPKVYDEKNKTYVPARVGCVPLAIGAIMSFFERPETLNGHAVNWDFIKSNMDLYSLPYLLAELGNERNLKTAYGVTNSSTVVSNMPNGFVNFGYTTCGAPRYDVLGLYMALNLSELKTQVNQKPYPVLMNAYNAYPVGHTWVADGGMTYTYSYNGFDFEDEQHPAVRLIHCCWGWGGTNNGYFKWDSKHPSINTQKPQNGEFDYPMAENTSSYVFSHVEYYVGYSPVK